MLLQGEVKDNSVVELPKQYDTEYGAAAAAAPETCLKADAQTGRHYVDLNAAMTTYQGAWLYGHEHVIVYVGKLKADWEQFCPIPADVRDGVLMKGNVLYRNADGTWRKSNDQFEGTLSTQPGSGGGRWFVGRTQHTFLGSNIPGGKLCVVANLNMHLSQSSPSNPLVTIPKPRAEQQNEPASYTQRAYKEPTLSYPKYETTDPDSGF
jgi:hypothetical protein